jgi:hypothetical protein
MCAIYFHKNSLQGKSQIIQEELAKLGEQMVQTSKGTRVIALGLCREFEDTFLQHIEGGEVSDTIAHPLHFFYL